MSSKILVNIIISVLKNIIKAIINVSWLYWLALALTVYILSCDHPEACEEGYSFNENIEVSTYEDCFNWTRNNITYAWDTDIYGRDYAQTPEQTYLLGAGDCEDKVLMTQYLLDKIGIDSEFIGIQLPNSHHAILRMNGNCYESIFPHPMIIDESIIIQELLYCEALYEAVNYHVIYIE